MNCLKCGAPNPEGTTTCRECGRPLATVAQYDARPVSRNSDTAIASLICGILGWSVLPVLGGVLAIVLGHMAKNDLQQSEGTLGGDGMATLGLVLGYANLGLAAVSIVAVVLLALLGIAIPLGIIGCGLCASI